MQSNNKNFNEFNLLNIEEFIEVFPWIGGDLQTIRDTFCWKKTSPYESEKIFIPVRNIIEDNYKDDYLLGYLDIPERNEIKGLIIVTHGLGGSTKRYGLRRISKKLLDEGFAVFKLNIRGAGSGRYLSNSNYSAKCSKDIISVVSFLRDSFKKREDYKFNKSSFPIFGIGLSLGGTIFLNACFDNSAETENSLFDGLACVSSPLDLLSCSKCIDKPRNYLYQKWLIDRLKRQVLNTQLENKVFESKIFTKSSLKKIKTIKEFDEKITAPIWGYKSVEEYYYKASPIFQIKNTPEKLPHSLLIHSKDDPWVPYQPTLEVKNLMPNRSMISILITEKGGHNGFHSARGCWSDEIVAKWIKSITETFN